MSEREVLIVFPTMSQWDRYEYIAEYERKYRPFPPRACSTSCMTSGSQERATAGREAEEHYKSTYASFFPLHGNSNDDESRKP